MQDRQETRKFWVSCLAKLVKLFELSTSLGWSGQGQCKEIWYEFGRSKSSEYSGLQFYNFKGGYEG